MTKWLLTREVTETIEVEAEDEDTAELTGDETPIEQWTRWIETLEVREL